jgi:hypothetical protein
MTETSNRTSSPDVVAARVQSTDGERPVARVAAMPRGRRQIGPVGTVTRVVVAGGFLSWGLLVPHRHPWLDLPGAGSRPWGLLVGLVALPALITALVRLRGRTAKPLRLGPEAACLVTGVLVLASFVAPVAVLTFIGGTMLLLAVVGRGGCEVMAVSNLVLGRHDYLACLAVSQIDVWEARRARSRSLRPADEVGQ